jgi:hypothetical protein
MYCWLPTAHRRSRQPAAADRDAPPPPGGSWTGVVTFCFFRRTRVGLVNGRCRREQFWPLGPWPGCPARYYRFVCGLLVQLLENRKYMEYYVFIFCTWVFQGIPSIPLAPPVGTWDWHRYGRADTTWSWSHTNKKKMLRRPRSELASFSLKAGRC